MFIFLFLPYFSRRTNKNITYKDRSERTLNERLSILQSSIIWQFYLVTFLSLVPLRTSKHCSLYVGLQDACASQTTLIRSPFICCRKYVTSPALVDWCFGIAPGCKTILLMVKIMAHMLLNSCGVWRSHRLQHQPLAAMRLQKQLRPYQPRKQPPWQYLKRSRALLQHQSLPLVSKDFLTLSFQHLLQEMISICYPLI